MQQFSKKLNLHAVCSLRLRRNRVKAKTMLLSDIPRISPPDHILARKQRNRDGMSHRGLDIIYRAGLGGRYGLEVPVPGCHRTRPSI